MLAVQLVVLIVLLGFLVLFVFLGVVALRHALPDDDLHFLSALLEVHLLRLEVAELGVLLVAKLLRLALVNRVFDRLLADRVQRAPGLLMILHLLGGPELVGLRTVRALETVLAVLVAAVAVLDVHEDGLGKAERHLLEVQVHQGRGHLAALEREVHLFRLNIS